ncbi:MAG TPA: DUF1801 domain-containing protein [Leucothrix sp.]|nr:DUF1801 domain-containing protein [Leucothrix sp.]
MTKPIQNNITNLKVAEKFHTYPTDIAVELMHLRQIIFEVSKELKLNDLEETLKWDQPSYLTKKGSTIRVDWKKTSSSDQFAMYFNCKTKLIDTFKEIYPDDFKYEGNRAIVFKLHQTLPVEKLKVCIELSLTYHSIRHLPLLGI